MDKPRGFPCNDSSNVEIARLARREILWRLFVQVPHEFDFAPEPSIGMRITQATSGIRGRPHIAPGDIEQDAAQRVVARGLANALLGCLCSGRFLRSIEARAHQHSRSPKHKRRREAATVGNSSSSHDRYALSYGIHDFWNEGDQAARCSVASRFRTLRDEKIRARRNCLLGKRYGLNLADDECTAAFDPVDPRYGRSEREHHRGRTALQSEIEQPRLFRNAPCDKSDAKARLRSFEKIEFPRKPMLLTVTTAEDTEPTGSIHGSDEATIGDAVHRGEQGWMLDAKHLCHRRNQHISSIEAQLDVRFAYGSLNPWRALR